ncbi:cation transporter [Pannonibacter sp. Pt2]|uniref:Cation transporter n=1 Tax=Pannonibacter anstelovis TaxID=3121537 RepID=A0ABU7ZUU7_9HYPH
MTEQSLLKLSIVATIALAFCGIGAGLYSGSFAVVFDGIYSLTDAFMTVLALSVARLIAASAQPKPEGKLVERFTMGFWHLEPIVLGLTGTLLIGAAFYALINAVDSLKEGGRLIAFDYAIAVTFVTFAVALAMAWFVSRKNRTLKSAFVALDAKGWFMSAMLSAALCVAFVAGYMLLQTKYAWLAPYTDPGILALVCLIIIPMPLANVKQALLDILLVTPPELKQHVDKVAIATVQKFGFSSHYSYVARVGRGRQIELFFIVPQNWPARRLEEWDAIRDEVGRELGGEGHDRWLTIVFTTDEEWAV